MNAKSFLQQYEIMNSRLKHLENEIESISAEVESINSIGDGMPKPSGVSDRVGNVAARLADLRTNYQSKVIELWAKRAEIVEVISMVDDAVQMKLLYDRYIRLMQWNEIAKDICMVEEYTRGGLHSKALEKIDIILKNLQNVT